MKVYQHATSMALPLLGLLVLASDNMPKAEAARETMTVDAGDITFSVDRYDDGRNKPYRVTFTEDGVESFYRFNTNGFVTNAVVESETYRVLYDSDGDLSRVRLATSSGRRRGLRFDDERQEQEQEQEPEPEPEQEQEVVDGLVGGDGQMQGGLINNNNNNNGNNPIDMERIRHHRRRLYACDDCVEAWDAVCDDGVPSVCNLVSYGQPISPAAKASIATMCDVMGGACSSSGGEEACSGQCEEDDDKVLNACLDSTSDSYRCSYEDTTTLDLSNCAFLDSDAEDIPDCFEAFGKGNIERLSMPFQDDLTTLPAGLFDGLTSLVDMDLSYTAISSLPAGVFSGLSGVIELEMHFSQLAAMPEGLFAGMTSMEKLIVSSAKLTSLPAEVFTPLTSLQALDLSLNADLQCIPTTTATEIRLFPDEPLPGMCECQPVEAIACQTGSCHAGENGYTCE